MGAPSRIHAFGTVLKTIGLVTAIACGQPVWAEPSPGLPTVVLVDKATHTLKMATYKDEGYEVFETYHATVGKVRGDKIDEHDLKTPEGVYFFGAIKRPPQLQKKFGALALTVDFPNAFDRVAGKTGNDIMLHSTNEPERLKHDYDSEGCVVVNDAEILAIHQKVRLGLTPILIFSELTDEWLKPRGDSRVNEFFATWIKDWEGKNLDGYIRHYHTVYRADNGKNLSEWRAYKGSLNQRYDRITVAPEKIHFFRHPKYAVIQFIQNYQSFLKNGKVGFQSRGTKTLYVAEEDDQLKIIEESYSPMTW